MKTLTIEQLKKEISYDPLTGNFTRLTKPLKSKNKLGLIRGTVKAPTGHLRTTVAGKEYPLQRLAWFYSYGEWPEIADHINGIPTDNRLANLRNTCRHGNVQNQHAPHITNTSGYLGVNYRKDKKKFVAEISVNNKKKHLGYFHCPKEAHEAYLDAKRKYHPTCTI